MKNEESNETLESIIPDTNTNFSFAKLYNNEFENLFIEKEKTRKKEKKITKKKETPLIVEEDIQEQNMPIVPNDFGNNNATVIFQDVGTNDSDDEQPGTEFNGTPSIPPENNDSNHTNEKTLMKSDVNNLTEYVQSYEDFCKKHLESYLHNSTSNSQEIQILKRVQEWTNSIEPKLEKESKRKPYDIEEYGEEVFNSFKEEKMISFEEVTKDKSPEEVCRIFLATLQLANLNSVQLETENDFILTRVLQPNKKRIQNYRAPSLSGKLK